MKFVVITDEDKSEYLRSCSPDSEWVTIKSREGFSAHADADAFFDLQDDHGNAQYKDIDAPVFIHSVNTTLTEMHAAQNIVRINAWPGFLEKEIWEIAGNKNSDVKIVLEQLGKKFIAVNDVTGFVTPRVIAMIINEAYFAVGEKISTKEEIDLAMKLGTNYPYGPFEWGNKIGLKNVYSLLEKLSVSDERYKAAPGLKMQISLLK